MLVIDDAGIGYPLGAEPLDDVDLILRFPEPSAMIVERDRATDFAGRLRNWPNALRFGLDAGLLLLRVACGFAAAGNPELGGQSVAFEHVENEPGLLIERRRKPPRQQPDVMPFQRFHFGVERRDVLGA